MRHSQNWTLDYSKIITRGVKGIREEAQAKLAALIKLRDVIYKKPFLDAVVLTCDAMSIWSRRYAAEARRMSEVETRANRKEELLKIAEVCEHVPENPACNSTKLCRRSGGRSCSIAPSRPRARWGMAASTSMSGPCTRNAVETLDRIRAAARDVRRIAVVEVPGAESGWLALQSANANHREALAAELEVDR